MTITEWEISNANLILPGEISGPVDLCISSGRITGISGPSAPLPDLLHLNLHGLALFPTLINAHDSLLATYDSVRGAGWPYLNWLAFDVDVKSSVAFKERLLIDAESLYLLGAYKNLLGGSVYVIDHIPDFVRAPFVNNLPVSILEDYGIAHSHCSYSLGWGAGTATEYTRAQKENLPFITHIAEGYDPESQNSLGRLYEEGGLGDRSVLIHGLSLSDRDLDRIADAGASIVWCPTANMQVYNECAPVRAILERGINLCIGTDSAMTGSADMLSELRAAASIYRQRFGEELEPERIFEMATRNAAKAFRMTSVGSIGKGMAADFFVLKNSPGRNPHEALLDANQRDIYLLVHNGVPLYGDSDLSEFFELCGVPYDTILVHGEEKIVVKGLEALLKGIGLNVGYEKHFSFLPVDFDRS
jgi:cytosine/adenosine deaminase-related metal-dependent hydrolase